MAKTLYLNLEDDVPKIAARLKRERSQDVVLVFPKQSFLFADKINLRLLKKQADVLGKNVAILTMDEHGQQYAHEAGFALKQLPKARRPAGMSDIQPRHRPEPVKEQPVMQSLRSVIERIRPQHEAVTPVEMLRENAPRKILQRPKNPRKKWLVASVAAGLIIIIALVTFVLPSAQLTVYAKSQPAARDVEVTASLQTLAPNSTQLALPALAIDEPRDVSNGFTATGTKQVGTNAQGRAAIYNLTGKPLTLRAGTTALTANGKTYTFLSDQVQIKSVSAATSPTAAPNADVSATGSGEAFNLPVGTRLEISNQVFGSHPDKLYAKVTTAVSGGTSRFLSVIAQKDFDQAKLALQDSAVQAVRDKLKQKNLILPDGAFTAAVDSFTADKPVGTQSPNFTAAAKVHIVGLAVDQAQLKDMVRQRLLMTLTENKSLQDPSKDTMSVNTKNLDLVAGTLTLSVHYESQIWPQLDLVAMRAQLAGKSKQEASELLLSNPDIDKVEISLSPGWQTHIPRFTSKINIKTVVAAP